MIPKWPHMRLARVTLELETPLSIASGAFDPIYDMPLVQDANGLPTIPGTSLAGAIRAALPSEHRKVFGDLDQSARLEFSFARIHDQHDRPVDGLRFDRPSLSNDPILRPLFTAPPLRQHVRLNERGTAADTGKFDRCVVPGGHRFSFELRLWGETADQDAASWTALRSRLCESAPRLGGGSRGGLGRVRVRRWLEDRFDLTTCADFDRWVQMPCRLDTEPKSLRESEGLKQEEMAADAGSDGLTFVLRPQGPWRIGDGTIPLGSGREPDRLPLVEEWIAWGSANGREQGTQELCVVIPGSGLKGTLRHRTLFHLRRLQSWFADDEAQDAVAEQLVATLFGWAAESATSDGQAGRLYFEDVRLPLSDVAPKTYPHNSIDRFSQGGRRGRLFSEEVLTGRPSWRLRVGLGDLGSVDPLVRCAFLLALEDLSGGALAIGAGAAKGQGFLEEAEPADWKAVRARLQIADEPAS